MEGDVGNASGSSMLARGVHYDRNPDQAHRSANDVVTIRDGAVDAPSPENRQHDKPTAIRRIDTPEMIGLISRHDCQTR